MVKNFDHLVKIFLKFLYTAHVILIFNTQCQSLGISARTIKLKGSWISIEIIHQKFCSILSKQPETNERTSTNIKVTKLYIFCFLGCRGGGVLAVCKTCAPFAHMNIKKNCCSCRKVEKGKDDRNYRLQSLQVTKYGIAIPSTQLFSFILNPFSKCFKIQNFFNPKILSSSNISNLQYKCHVHLLICLAFQINISRMNCRFSNRCRPGVLRPPLYGHHCLFHKHGRVRILPHNHQSITKMTSRVI